MSPALKTYWELWCKFDDMLSEGAEEDVITKLLDERMDKPWEALNGADWEEFHTLCSARQAAKGQAS